MSQTLKIRNNFTLTPLTGSPIQGKQGSIADDIDDFFSIAVTGYAHLFTGLITTGAAMAKLYDAAVNVSVTAPVYIHFWADQDCYLQFIGSASNYIVKVTAKEPYIMSTNNCLAAVSTTAYSSATAPSVETLAKVYCGNYSGTNANAILQAIQ